MNTYNLAARMRWLMDAVQGSRISFDEYTAAMQPIEVQAERVLQHLQCRRHRLVNAADNLVDACIEMRHAARDRNWFSAEQSLMRAEIACELFRRDPDPLLLRILDAGSRGWGAALGGRDLVGSR